MKRLSRLVVFTLLCAMVMAACSSSTPTSSSKSVTAPTSKSSQTSSGKLFSAVVNLKKIKGAVIYNFTPSTDNPWQAVFDSSFAKEASELGMVVRTETNAFDPETQNSQIQSAISSHPAMFAVLPASASAVVPALLQAKSAGIPVLIEDSPLLPGNSNLYVSEYGSNQYTLGYDSGESICQAVKKSGRTSANVAEITGAQSFYLVTLQMEGFKAAISSCSVPLHLVSIQDGEFSTSASASEASSLFAEYTGSRSLAAVSGAADNQAVAIISAAKSAGLSLGVGKNKLVVVGSNCLTSGTGLTDIQNGLEYATNTQIASVQGAESALLVAAHLSGQVLPKTLVDPTTIITKSNVSTFAPICKASFPSKSLLASAAVAS